jgi:hypothetical protein
VVVRADLAATKKKREGSGGRKKMVKAEERRWPQKGTKRHEKGHDEAKNRRGAIDLQGVRVSRPRIH